MKLHIPFRYFYFFLIAIQILTSDLFAYERPTNIDEGIWAIAAPHFLPEEHPMKKKLDTIFKAARVSSSPESMKRSGFKIRKGRHWDNVYVCKHKKLKGYVLKVYMDNQMGVNEWDPLVRRVTGANAIRESIAKLGYKHIFKVPNKWIYPLPENPTPNPKYQRKNFILIADEMNVFRNARNEQRWFGPTMTADKLKAFFHVLNDVGLIDSVFPTNVPFCTDGMLAFIDTEHHHKWPIPYHRLVPYLAEDMQHIWTSLVQSKGF